MNPIRQSEHEWLQKLVGDWTYEAEMTEPGKPPTKSTGTESVRSIDGIWVVCEGHGHPDAGPETAIMTLGYDSDRKRFVGTWIGSGMTYLWIYDGSLDADGKVLTLDSEGPSMADDGSMAKYQDVIELVSDDYRTLTALVQGTDGQWQEFVTTSYHRIG